MAKKRKKKPPSADSEMVAMRERADAAMKTADLLILRMAELTAELERLRHDADPDHKH
jgi:hypothetical protein